LSALLLRGCRVLDGPAFIDADVLIDGTRVKAVGPRLVAPPGATVWELGGDLVIPGLINAHYHSPDNLNTGRMPLAPLELWSLASVPSRVGQPDELRLAALLGAAQLVRGGVTGVVDMVRPWPTLSAAGLDALGDAYVQSGMRVAIAPVLADLPIEQTLPFGPLPEPRPCGPVALEQLGVVEAFYQSWHGRHERIQVHVAPSAPQRCSEELLVRLVELADRLDTQLHTHALETRAQREQSQRRWAKSQIEHLDLLGGLQARTVLAHLVWASEADLDRIGQRGAVVVHNPTSNAALGSGRAPLPGLLARGISTGLGTDAATCNDGLSMFEAMKLATLLPRSHEPDWTLWPDPVTVLRLAVEGGAAALGLADQLGRIEPGRLADLVVLDARSPAFVPPNDLVHQLVMRGDPSSVRHVLVGGKTVLRDRTLLTLNWEALVDQAQAYAQRRAPVSDVDDPLRPRIVELLRTFRQERRV
jgi:5-methylthioadenosine/S-adenosylhomocysteine deaminase